MHDTGRIKSLLHPEARVILFDSDLSRAIDCELPHYVKIDRAHGIMLVQAGLLARTAAAALFAELDRLEREGFKSLEDVQTPRGSYLGYEAYLTEKLGTHVAGNIHLGRSRNDINATVFRLQLRRPYVELIQELIDLILVLATRAEEYSETVFPLYTHRQPAVPSTLGHHLAAFAAALLRDLEALLALRAYFEQSCLGAGAGGGTTLPINFEMTARYLGFTAPPRNSIDSVASRDLALRTLAAAAVLSTTLSRVAESMLIWVGDAGLLTLPDELVGSSSAMPNKRNPFILEHVQGKSGSVLGDLVGAMAATRSTPFTNCVASGTDAIKHVWPGLKATIECVRLARLCVAGFETIPGAIDDVMASAFVNAMEAATILAADGAMDFRSAHASVGAAVTQAMEQGRRSFVEMLVSPATVGLQGRMANLDPASIAVRARFGGGPSAGPVVAHVKEMKVRTNEVSADVRRLEDGWRHADEELRLAVAQIQGGHDEPAPPGRRFSATVGQFNHDGDER